MISQISIGQFELFSDEKLDATNLSKIRYLVERFSSEIRVNHRILCDSSCYESIWRKPKEDEQLGKVGHSPEAISESLGFPLPALPSQTSPDKLHTILPVDFVLRFNKWDEDEILNGDRWQS